MNTTIISTLRFRDQYLELPASKIKDFLPENIHDWEFQHRKYTVSAAIRVGGKLSTARMGSAFGTDPEILAVVRGKFLAEELVTEPADLSAVPPVVLKLFGRAIEYGEYPTEEELASLLRPAKTAGETKTAEVSPAETEKPNEAEKPAPDEA